MIDYYRNGKYQLLFSGRDYLHLIDRNGNYVDKFPVKTEVAGIKYACSCLIMRTIRITGCSLQVKTGRYMLYDRSGSPVRGWNLFTTRGKVTDPVTFFRVKGKDYLFAADDQAVYVLDRTGNIRVSPRGAP
ncbi:MAG: hypothetical protein MZV63_47655 [Marinilabiliales bacterium]|nr:hypothetical protein [Marinilabiliales bacterium]